ncbi:MAG: hypothetical protein DRI74_04070 [Bacteroidetes bacterium]|nr:MAG: hypothetical protein DRI74_04070 [Bacteroidota bacterium]
MLQEIIVYIILTATALHLLRQAFIFFSPSKDQGNSMGCAGGSCANCSLKIDFSSIQLKPEENKLQKFKFENIK